MSNLVVWILCIIYFICLSSLTSTANDDQDLFAFEPVRAQSLNVGTAKPRKRYLLYSINPGEGFNLRRDVYMRVASLVKMMNDKEDWTLVLPPWGPLYHWKTEGLKRDKYLWKTFFDIQSLNLYVPVIEFEDFLTENGPVIDDVLYLQHFEGDRFTGHFEEKIEETECIEAPRYSKHADGKYRGWFWGYERVAAKNFHCLSAQGFAAIVIPALRSNYSKARSVLIDRAETLLHNRYGDEDYWQARRSLRFAKPLIDMGDAFRRDRLDSTDDGDITTLHPDWRDHQVKPGHAIGGPYIAAHLRRRDFLYGHRDDVPSINRTALQLLPLIEKYKAKKVFIASDAPDEEFEELKLYIPIAIRYVPPKEILKKYGDGGVAIIDQWICAHARYFVGTSVSTFSFRIQEEREILGFDPDVTFNRLCGDKQESCEQPARWKIRY
ncbi:PREDICTED: GDP-fucose protein O-fucosyltransferase 2-like [Priapulus caudatus]|uniref:GDP-fucose protein O-fucosyltransferase 2 n=1 Tax=Priapulus caudatus TaxID=37621 RepID=A0ABM1EGI6_PRICU|nr:PREDICTED: GDP-fucose protein O-fucosyltransferase 2-like [Priapulus caudatus]